MALRITLVVVLVGALLCQSSLVEAKRFSLRVLSEKDSQRRFLNERQTSNEATDSNLLTSCTSPCVKEGQFCACPPNDGGENNDNSNNGETSNNGKNEITTTETTENDESAESNDNSNNGQTSNNGKTSTDTTKNADTKATTTQDEGELGR